MAIIKKIKTAVARALAPDMLTGDQVQALIDARLAETQARMAAPINVDYDPHGEGYRRVAGTSQVRTDMSGISQAAMFTLAYYLYDVSGMVKRFVRDTKNFVLGAGIDFSVENDHEDGSALQVLNDFWVHPYNRMDRRLEKRIEFLGLLGEQCWPVQVDKRNGRVLMTYVDPQNIDSVFTVRDFPEMPAAVKLVGAGGRPGRIMPCVRSETDARNRAFGRLVGECFFFSINNPPNDPRGRSDLIHSFDFIERLEENIFDELDRMAFIKGFVWDVEIQGADEAAIKNFLKDNRPPKSGSIRAHNERIKWQAVAPNMGQSESKAFFEFARTYLAATQNRPDNWYGAGGKVYQNEADLMGEPTFQDLGARQRDVRGMLTEVLQFVLDQATLAGTIRPPDGNAAWEVAVSMPEMHTKDIGKISQALASLSLALVTAQINGWITRDKATEIYASVANNLGVYIDPNKMILAAEALGDVPPGGDDYAAAERRLAALTAKAIQDGKTPDAQRAGDTDQQNGAPTDAS